MREEATDRSIGFEALERAPGRVLAQIVRPAAEASGGEAADESGLWGPDELALILREYLDTPAASGGSDASDIATFGEVLRDPAPPLAMLERLRDVGESGRAAAELMLPPEVSGLLYFTAAASALVHHGRRITQADDATLARGMRWAAGQSWVDEDSRAALRAGLAALQPAGNEAVETDNARQRSVGRPLPEVPHVPGYEVTGRLGEGGMGVVWRAVQLATRREVALKVLAGAFPSGRTRQRFEREVELAARLDHPHVARVFDSGSFSGQFYYAMELVDGVHLDRYAQARKLSERQVGGLFRHVCLAVQHAHDRGILHRDLKPSNILVTPDGVPKVLDFGLAKALAPAPSDASPVQPALTETGEWVGTPAFMSPEQASGRALDARADVWALGATLYLLLTGQHPHDVAGPRIEVLRRIATREVRRPRQLRPGIDPDLEALLLKALDEDPARRYASAGELAADLDRFLSGRPLVARAPTLTYRIGKFVRRRRAAVALGAAVVAVLGGLAGFHDARVESHRLNAAVSDRTAGERQVRADAESARAAAAARATARTEAVALSARGDTHARGGEWDKAAACYEQARQSSARIGESTFLADVALWHCHLHSPPPLLNVLAHPGSTVTGVAFRPGGSAFLSAGEDGTIREWDLLLGTPLRTFEGAGRVRHLAVSDDGRTAASASADQGVVLWDLEAGRRLRRVEGYAGEAVTAALSADGRLLLVGTSDRARNAYLYEAPTGRLVREFSGHRSSVAAVTFCPDGRTALTGSAWEPNFERDNPSPADKDNVRCWDLGTGDCLWVDTIPFSRIAPTAGAVQGANGGVALMLPLGIGEPAQWREVATGKLIAKLKVEQLTTTAKLAAAVGPGGEVAAAGTQTGHVYLWRVLKAPSRSEPRLALANVGFGHSGPVMAVAFSPDGRLALSAGADGTVRCWNVNDALRPAAGVEATDFAQAGSAPGTRPPVPEFHVSWSPDERLALSGGTRGVRLWDVATGIELARSASARTGFGRQALFAPDGRSVIMIDRQGRIGEWELTMQAKRRPIGPPDGVTFTSLAISPDGKLLAAVTSSAGDRPLPPGDEVYLFKWPGGAALRSIKFGGMSELNSVKFAADGTKLVAASTGDVGLGIYDVASGVARTLDGIDDVDSACAVPASSLVALSGPRLRLVDLTSGATVRELRNDEFPHRAVAATPDGRYITASGSDENGLSFWDSATGVEVQALDRWAQGDPFDLAFSLDGRRLLVAQMHPTGNVALLDFGRPAQHRAFAALLRAAQSGGEAGPGTRPVDGRALAAFGTWYAFRGRPDLAAGLLERARTAGTDVSPVLLARCHWRSGNSARASEEFRRAADEARRRREEAEAQYLDLCRAAAERPVPLPVTRPTPTAATGPTRATGSPAPRVQPQVPAVGG